MSIKNSNSGWARPLNSRKHHFFNAGEVISICGKWMLYTDNREPDTFQSPDDCAACRRRLDKDQSK